MAKESGLIRVIICGTRTFDDYDLLKITIDHLYQNKEIIIISGGANGADKLGERYAKNRGLKVITYEAKWEVYGKSAGPRRNSVMAANADECVAFWDGVSKGTEHMLSCCQRFGVLLHLVKLNNYDTI